VRILPRRPSTIVWIAALAVAVGLGFVIAGSPVVPRDVPLRDRIIATTGPSTTEPSVTLPSTTTVPSVPPTAGPIASSTTSGN